MEQVLRDHRLADAVWADEDDVGGLLEEVQGEQFFEELAIDLFGPGVIEVGDGFELEEACVAEAALETATFAVRSLRSRARARARVRCGSARPAPASRRGSGA